MRLLLLLELLERDDELLERLLLLELLADPLLERERLLLELLAEPLLERERLLLELLTEPLPAVVVLLRLEELTLALLLERLEDELPPHRGSAGGTGAAR